MDFVGLKRLLENLLKTTERQSKKQQHFWGYKKISGSSTRDRQLVRSLGRIRDHVVELGVSPYAF